MFILRSFRPLTGERDNLILGDRYQFITREHNPEEFKKTFEQFWKSVMMHEEETNTYAFIICKDGSMCVPLYKKGTYYIMTSNGNTFENVTHKD